MGTEVLIKIGEWFSWITTIRSNAEFLALTGLILIGVVLIIYMSKGLALLGKWLLNLRVNQFTLVLAIMGIALIATALLMP